MGHRNKLFDRARGLSRYWKRFHQEGCMTRNVLVTGIFLAAGLAADDSPAVTFQRDVLPILQKNCQTCHRPGQVAPMSFLTYQQARPWAKAMKAAVVARKMPPWFADPRVGSFLNDHSLHQNDIDAIARWADSGAAEGDQKDAPP